METEQSNETEAFEENKPKEEQNEENKDKTENNPKPITSIEVTESGADIMKQINEEAEKLDTIIDKNDIKVFSKYEDLDENELKKLLEEKAQNILKLNAQKEETKNNLSLLLHQINKVITDNYNILYKEKPDPELIFDLHKEVEFKLKELKISKKMNESVKKQYETVNNKLNKKLENNKNVEENSVLINELRTKNKKLLITIRKYKDNITFPNKNNKDEKNENKVIDTKEFPNLVKNKSDEIRNLTMQKHEYFKKIKNSIKSLDNIKKEISHLEEILKKQEDKDKNEKLNNKINFWLNLIKDDLSGNSDENIDKILKNESNFIKENNKIELKNKNSNNNKQQVNPIDENKSSSDERYNLNMSFKEVNIPYISSSNMNRNNIMSNSKSLHKGVFAKFNYLKKGKPLSSSLNKIKINNYKLPNEELKINQVKENIEDIDSNNDIIIQKDFDETTDEDYRQLLEKKSQYLETNVRLEKNIKEIKKTKKSKYLNIYLTVQQNNKRLDELREQNNLLENEIMGLQKLFLLTIDKEKLKMEIKEKNKLNKLENIRNKYKDKQEIKLDSSLATENNILNELKDSNDSAKMRNMTNENKKKKNNNKSGYVEELSTEKSVTETREQRLEKIRKKYLVDNDNDEIYELNTNEEQTKENNLLKNNSIIKDIINKEENKENNENLEDKKENIDDIINKKEEEFVENGINLNENV